MLWWAAISSSLEHSHQECQKAKNVINNNQHTKNTLHQRSQMLKFLSPFYSKLPSLATHCSWVSKLNINFLIPTCALSLIFSFSHAFFFLSFSSPSTQALLFSLWSNPKTQAWNPSALRSHLKTEASREFLSWRSWASFLSWFGLCSWLGLRLERLGHWGGGHRRG